MYRYVWSFLCILVGGLILVPNYGEIQHDQDNMMPQQELTMKQDILFQDVQLTDQLCRLQCMSDFRKTIQKINQDDPQHIRNVLQEMQSHHPHMKQLIWDPHSSGSKDAVIVGEQDSRVNNKQLAAIIQKAKQTAADGSVYQSARIEADGHAYFVLGVPSSDGQSSLLGVVHQDILRKVNDHQNKNLRILTYPPDHQWKIQSVDAETLQDVTVNHPEDNEGTSHYHVNEVVVKFKQTPSDNEFQRIQAEIQANLVRKLGDTYVFHSAHLEAKQLMNYFQQWNNVDYAEPHFIYLTNADVNGAYTVFEDANTFIPNDDLYRQYQWNLPIIETELGWNITKGTQSVIVGVVDTGVDLHHPDLKDNLLQGTNIVDPESPPLDDVGHGTHVAGVVSAIVNNNLGVAGMTWANPVLPIKVLDHTGAGSTYAVAQGIIWAADHGAKVINLSLGNYAAANFLHDAVKYAFERDVVLVAASGNDNTEKPGYPAAYPEVFAVSATDANKNRASFSNYGDYIDVSAPGVNIASTYPDNQYAALSGTSMASPHVTALAALIRSVNPQLRNTEVMDIMRKTAVDLGARGKDHLFGYGQIDVVKALQYAMNDKSMEVEIHQKNPKGLSGWLHRILRKFAM